MFFEGLAADLQNEVAEFELGVTKGLVLWPADQETGDRDEFLVGQLAEPEGQGLSFRFLLGGQIRRP